MLVFLRRYITTMESVLHSSQDTLIEQSVVLIRTEVVLQEVKYSNATRFIAQTKVSNGP